MAQKKVRIFLLFKFMFKGSRKVHILDIGVLALTLIGP